MAYALKLKQLDAELSKKSSQLKIEADKVIKLQEENLKLKQEQMVHMYNYIALCYNVNFM